MKLFIWSEFCPDWRGGLAFAIAKDEEDAKKQIVKIMGPETTIKEGDWGPLEIKPLTRRIARAVEGAG